MREANSVLLDRALYLWFSQRSKGDPISGPLLYKKALELNEKLGGSADFKGSTEFQECDEEDVETWMACEAEVCGFQLLNDDEIVTSMQEESDPVNDETDEAESNNNSESWKGLSNNMHFLH
ncbi:uncharacterized protein TNCV_3806811 [Trichonephila clavipes]|nr:uncharacterized protein TNCV_3806811 [Trichonephila clavipes]